MKKRRSVFLLIYLFFIMLILGVYTIAGSIVQLLLSFVFMFTPDLRSNTMWKIGRVVPRMLLFFLGCKPRIEGIEKIPNYNPKTQSGKFCIMSNHTSILDIVAICGCAKIKVGFIAKSSLKHIPILNIYMKAINCVFIDRKSIRSNIEAINGGVRNLNNNIPMVIFPEGHRSKTGQVGKFLDGSSKLAIRSTAPVSPLAITGLRSFFEDRKKLRRPKEKPVLRFLDPVITSSLEVDDRKKLSTTLETIIKDEIKKIREQTN